MSIIGEYNNLDYCLYQVTGCMYYECLRSNFDSQLVDTVFAVNYLTLVVVVV